MGSEMCIRDRSSFLGEYTKGSVVEGVVKEVDAKGVIVELPDGVEGHIKASELGRDRVEDARNVLKVGDKIEAKFLGIDRKKRSVSLSVKAKESDDESAAVQEYSASTAAGTTTLGDIMKEQMDNN